MTRPTKLNLTLPDIAATERLAQALSKIAAPGVCILLEGPVGAGKTFLARKTLQTLMLEHGAVEDVPSPTFTLVQTYDIGALEVWHADLYRLTSPDELTELGIDAAFEQAFCLIEWPDRMGDLTPPNAISLELKPDPNHMEARRVEIAGPASLIAPLENLFMEAAP